MQFLGDWANLALVEEVVKFDVIPRVVIFG
jgi:hypothetical protein